jgi:hypothetical protein
MPGGQQFGGHDPVTGIAGMNAVWNDEGCELGGLALPWPNASTTGW